MNQSHKIYSNSFEWGINDWHLSQRNTRNSSLSYGSLTNITRSAKPNHACTKSWPPKFCPNSEVHLILRHEPSSSSYLSIFLAQPPVKSRDPVKQNETHVKLLDEKLSGGVESADGVQSRSRVDSDHKNVDQVVVGRLSLFQRLVAAALHVRFQSRQGVEVGVDRSIRARGVAANSHKVGVANFHVAAKPNRFPVHRLIVVTPYHLRTTKRACMTHTLTKNTHTHTRL